MGQRLALWINGMSINGAVSAAINKRYLQPTTIDIQVNKQDDIYAPTMGNHGDKVEIEYDFNFFASGSSIRAEKFYGMLDSRKDKRDGFGLSTFDGFGMLSEEFVEAETAFASGTPIGATLRTLLKQSKYHTNPLGGNAYIDSMNPIGLASLTLPERIEFDGSESLLEAVTMVMSIVDTSSEYVSMWAEPNGSIPTASGTKLFFYADTCAPSNNIIYTSEIVDFEKSYDRSNVFSKVSVKDSDGNIGEYPKNDRYPYTVKRINVSTDLGIVTLQNIARHYYKKYRITDNEVLAGEPSKITLRVIPMHTLNYRPGDLFRIYIKSDEYYDKILYDARINISNSGTTVDLVFGNPRPDIKQLIRQM